MTTAVRAHGAKDAMATDEAKRAGGQRASARGAKRAAAAEPRGPQVETPAARDARETREARDAADAALAAEAQCRVELPAAGFEGPLDLLLHLIQSHELDILNIPVAFVTARYLAYLRLMESLSIDLASEYLVMAATLVHIKSKMLLPVAPTDQAGDGLEEEEEDPRAELVRRLLEYQKYKAAGAELDARAVSARDMFPRGSREPAPTGPAPFAPPGLFSLLDAFESVLKRTKVRIDHEVVFDRISITDRMLELTDRLKTRRSMRFDELFESSDANLGPTRFDLIITFLAVLEMAKLRLLRVFQTEPLAPIHLELRVTDETSDDEQDFAYEEAAVGSEGAGEPIEADENVEASDEASDDVSDDPGPGAGRDGASDD